MISSIPPVQFSSYQDFVNSCLVFALLHASRKFSAVQLTALAPVSLVSQDSVPPGLNPSDADSIGQALASLPWDDADANDTSLTLPSVEADFENDFCTALLLITSMPRIFSRLWSTAICGATGLSEAGAAGLSLLQYGGAAIPPPQKGDSVRLHCDKIVAHCAQRAAVSAAGDIHAPTPTVLSKPSGVKRTREGAGTATRADASSLLRIVLPNIILAPSEQTVSTLEHDIEPVPPEERPVTAASSHLEPPASHSLTSLTKKRGSSTVAKDRPKPTPKETNPKSGMRSDLRGHGRTGAGVKASSSRSSAVVPEASACSPDAPRVKLERSAIAAASSFSGKGDSPASGSLSMLAEEKTKELHPVAAAPPTPDAPRSLSSVKKESTAIACVQSHASSSPRGLASLASASPPNARPKPRTGASVVKSEFATGASPHPATSSRADTKSSERKPQPKVPTHPPHRVSINARVCQRTACNGFVVLKSGQPTPFCVSHCCPRCSKEKSSTAKVCTACNLGEGQTPCARPHCTKAAISIGGHRKKFCAAHLCRCGRGKSAADTLCPLCQSSTKR